jgi:hypothetical protein
MNKLKLKLIAALGLLVIVGAFGVGKIAYADETFDWTRVETKVAQMIFDQHSQEPEPNIGALSTADNLGDHYCVSGVCYYTLVGTIRATSTAAIPTPFQIATTTVGGGVVINQVSSAYGYTGNTTTIDRVWVVTASTTAPTTTWSIDCTAGSNPGVTTTLAILKPESSVPGNLAVNIESGITSSTSAGGIGSAVYASNGELAGIKPLVTRIRLTPAQPYLVCKAYQPSGTSLDTLTGSSNVGTIKVYAQFSRPQF